MSEVHGGKVAVFSDNDGKRGAEDRLSRERSRPARRPPSYRRYAVDRGMVVWQHEWPQRRDR